MPNFALAFAALAVHVGSLPAAPIVEAETTHRTTPASITALWAVGNELGADQRIAVVSFYSDFLRPFRDNDDSAAPATGLRSAADGTGESFALHGVFTLIRDVDGRAPPAGRVDRAFAVDVRRRPDAVMARLACLSSAVTVGPVYVVAVMPPDCRQFADAAFWGPIPASEADRFCELIGYLRANPFAKASPDAAEKLLDSDNPWLVGLGLAALESRKALKPAHFVAAFRKMPTEYLDELYSSMVHLCGRNQHARLDMTAEFLPYVWSEAPERRLKLLSALARYASNCPDALNPVVNVGALRAQARERLRQMQADPQRAAEVEQLRFIVAARVHPPVVERPAKELRELALEIGLSTVDAKVKESLIESLEGAARLLDRGSLKGGRSGIDEFDLRVRAAAGKKLLTEPVADARRARVLRVLAKMEKDFGLLAAPDPAKPKPGAGEKPETKN
jgi:hypothetical protein